METIDARTGLEVLYGDECRRLLGQRHVGRLGVAVAGRPVILPVNYVVDAEGTIVFRTDEGLKLRSALRGTMVAFEIDETDTTYHTGWSVLVTGVAEEIDRPEDVEHVEGLGLRPWAPGPKAHYLRIRPLTMTGRRIQPAHV